MSRKLSLFAVTLLVFLFAQAASSAPHHRFVAKATVTGVVLGGRPACVESMAGCILIIATAAQPTGDIPALFPTARPPADTPGFCVLLPPGTKIKTEGYLTVIPPDSTSCLRGQLVYVPTSVALAH